MTPISTAATTMAMGLGGPRSLVSSPVTPKMPEPITFPTIRPVIDHLPMQRTNAPELPG
ncbi:MAG TPA: hypothetical protein VK466_14845 [Terriglobales bacterium]|nr:hypothetical protein [Terriglobales bacterium]